MVSFKGAFVATLASMGISRLFDLIGDMIDFHPHKRKAIEAIIILVTLFVLLNIRI